MENSCIWDVPPEKRHCKYCLLTHCDERRTEKYRRHGKVMPKMRKMGVGEELVFGYEAYNSCRTAATRLRAEMDAFIITRAEDDGVHVVRIS
jgi:hypothetical protein